jgi:hypothetical protein
LAACTGWGAVDFVWRWKHKFGGWCRGTFVGQKYGPFNDIPAVWDKFFGSKGYKALAAGIAGALATTSSSHVLSRPL